MYQMTPRRPPAAFGKLATEPTWVPLCGKRPVLPCGDWFHGWLDLANYTWSECHAAGWEAGLLFRRRRQRKHLAGMDFDSCRDPKTREVAPWVAEVARDLPADAYWELSQSGTGFHVVGWADLPTDRGSVQVAVDAEPLGKPKPPKLEIYWDRQALHITGSAASRRPMSLNWIQGACERWVGSAPAPAPAVEEPSRPAQGGGFPPLVLRLYKARPETLRVPSESEVDYRVALACAELGVEYDDAMRLIGQRLEETAESRNSAHGARYVVRTVGRAFQQKGRRLE